MGSVSKQNCSNRRNADVCNQKIGLYSSRITEYFQPYLSAQDVLVTKLSHGIFLDTRTVVKQTVPLVIPDLHCNLSI